MRTPSSPLKGKASGRLLIVASAAIFSLTGCSEHPPKRGPEAEQMAPAAPAMSAQDTYFDGTLLVEANLGRGFSGGRGGGGPGGGPGGGGGGHGGGGHHGGGMRGGGGGGMGGRGEDGPGEGGMGGGPGGGYGGGGTSIRESNMPPIALRLRLTNKSKETVEVTFVLCKSELGDFAVRPEKLALAPDQTAEPDPMTSRLGLPSDELVLRVSLRINGKVEQKDLVLRPIPKAEPEPATSAKP